MNQSGFSVIRLFLGCFSLVLVIGLFRSTYKQVTRGDIVTERTTVLNEVKKKNIELQERLTEATSTAFIEKQARDKLGLVRKGDTVVLMQAQRDSVTGAVDRVQAVSYWRQWIQLFF